MEAVFTRKRGLLSTIAVALALFMLLAVAGPFSAEAAKYEIVDGNNAFAFDIYRQISASPGNIFISPYSISSALAMAYAGARGNTAEQMAKALRYLLPQDDLHKAFGQLNSLFNEAKKDYKLSVVNALWSQDGLEFVKSYMNTVQGNYEAGLRLVDFANNTEGARLAINKWVEEKTENKIIELIKPGVLNSLTRLVLTNAIYFKGQWKSQFKKELTQNSSFNLNALEKAEVPFMHLQEKFNYAEGDGFQAVELPYSGDDLSMIVLLPTPATGISQLESKLDYKMLQAIIGKLQPATVNVSLPKFKFEAGLGLGGYLQKMGMTDAFSERLADFSGISNTFLYITAVIHKAFIEVNEEGSEAAAATAVVMGTKSIEMPMQFTADRPFFFLIRDLRSGSLLFMGRVADPRK